MTFDQVIGQCSGHPASRTCNFPRQPRVGVPGRLLPMSSLCPAHCDILYHRCREDGNFPKRSSISVQYCCVMSLSYYPGPYLIASAATATLVSPSKFFSSGFGCKHKHPDVAGAITAFGTLNLHPCGVCSGPPNTYPYLPANRYSMRLMPTVAWPFKTRYLSCV